jgi:phosphonopyruvate decarboxylase
MITAAHFIEEARGRGFDFFTGVPCSFLTPLINGVLNHPTLRYVGATSEGEAVALAAGAWLAGRQPVVMCQNSGLGNIVNPVTSLNAPFRIPALLITTWRGHPGIHDEPQHQVMGQITQDLLSLIGIRHAPFPTTADALLSALDLAVDWVQVRELPCALVMEKGNVAEEPLAVRQPPCLTPGQRWADDAASSSEPPPSRASILQQLLDDTDDLTAIIATTGKCGRELFTLADRPQHLYLVGSMGGASAVGLGVALNTTKRVIVLDGDGAALMKLGNAATIGACRPANLLHIVLDNGVHDSTGGQPTVSASVDFAAVALACGYRYAATCRARAGFGAALRRAMNQDGPTLLHVHIAPGSLDRLGRPTVAPADVARRFRAFVTTDNAR